MHDGIGVQNAIIKKAAPAGAAFLTDKRLLGFDTERQIRRTPANQAGCQWHNADITPPADFARYRKPNQNQTSDDTNCAVCAANILRHDESPELMKRAHLRPERRIQSVTLVTPFA
jgi:hypothetical protein